MILTCAERPATSSCCMAVLATFCLCADAAPGQQDPQNTEQRLRHLEDQNRQLRAMVAGISEQTQEMATGGGSSPVSIGGYGEILFIENQGRTDRADALRVVMYFGYQFDERWNFSSELELEHASTDKNGEMAVEMAQLEYQLCDDLAVRGGLLLVPMGLLNERHEPTTFLPTQRPETERRIIPTTWREIGVGLRGACGSF